MKYINWKVPAIIVFTIIYFLLPLQVVGWIIGENIKGVFTTMEYSDLDVMWYLITGCWFLLSISLAGMTVDKKK